MKLNEIQDLIKFVAKSGVSEVEVETKDIKIVIKTPAAKSIRQNEMPAVVQAVAPVATQAPAPSILQIPVGDNTPEETKKESASDESKYVIIKSPMIGTFYRSPSPDKPSFVSIGDDVKQGKIICMIEAMKLFNEIESDITGKIVKVLVDDASPVEYDQALFLVDPS